MLEVSGYVYSGTHIPVNTIPFFRGVTTLAGDRENCMGSILTRISMECFKKLMCKPVNSYEIF